MRWIALVLAVVVACGEAEEVVWEDPMVEPEGWESPYSVECHDMDSELDISGYGSAVSGLRAASRLDRNPHPGCMMPHDGLGGRVEECEDISERGQKLHHACGYYVDISTMEPYMEAVACLWAIQGSVVEGVCEYQVACVPEHRWSERNGAYTAWGEEHENQCDE